MKLLICILLLASGFCYATEMENNVLVLTNENFEKALSSQPEDPGHVLVEFYAPWCGHCKKLKPEYDEAAKRLSNNVPPLRLAKIDCINNKEACRPYEVHSFPTIHLVKTNVKGKTTEYGDAFAYREYNGPRTASGIVKFMREMTPKSSVITELSTVSDVDNRVRQGEAFVLGLFSHTDSNEYAVFKEASLFGEMAFTMSSNPDIMNKYGGEGSIALFRAGVSEAILFEGDFSMPSAAKDLDSWILHHELPLVSVYSDKTASKIFGPTFENHLLLFVQHHDPAKEAVIKTFREAAESFRNHGTAAPKCAIVHPSALPGIRKLTEFYGLPVQRNKLLPATLVMSTRGERRIRKFKINISAETVAKGMLDFVERVLKEDEPEYFRSQPVLKEALMRDSAGIRVVVGKTFDTDIIEASGKRDVLLEYYAPWCKHCRAFASQYAQVAKALADLDSIVVAKIDATQNEVQHSSAETDAFPKLKLYQAGEDATSPLVFKGKRDAETVLKWVVANAKIPINEAQLQDTQERDL